MTSLMTPAMTPEALTAVLDATWPAVFIHEENGWAIRQGNGGGSRVSAATRLHPDASIREAERAMRALGQSPLFMLRSGEEALDAELDAACYSIKDPVTVYSAPIATLATGRPPTLTCFEVWPPLASQTEIWAAGGIGPARLAVMERACAPKTTILGRLHDTPAGTAFGAVHDGTAMVHAIETASAFRRQGLARHMLRALAHWAQSHGAGSLCLAVTRANTGANALYSSIGMAPVGKYHYRVQLAEQQPDGS